MLKQSTLQFACWAGHEFNSSVNSTGTTAAAEEMVDEGTLRVTVYILSNRKLQKLFEEFLAIFPEISIRQIIFRFSHNNYPRLNREINLSFFNNIIHLHFAK